MDESRRRGGKIRQEPAVDSRVTPRPDPQRRDQLRPAEAGILGLLAVASDRGDDLSGYDLKRQIDASVGYLWSAAKSQVYTVLGRLAGRGLVTARHVEQQQRPDKMLYRITRAGRDALHEWLGQPAEPNSARNVLLLRIFFGELNSKEKVLADIEAERERARRLRRELEMLHESSSAHESTVYRSLTRAYGFAWADMVEEWAAHALRTLTVADEDGAPKAKRRKTPR